MGGSRSRLFARAVWITLASCVAHDQPAAPPAVPAPPARSTAADAGLLKDPNAPTVVSKLIVRPRVVEPKSAQEQQRSLLNSELKKRWTALRVCYHASLQAGVTMPKLNGTLVLERRGEGVALLNATEVVAELRACLENTLSHLKLPAPKIAPKQAERVTYAVEVYEDSRSYAPGEPIPE